VLALGVRGIGLREALVCYAFALGMGLIIPIPIDLGLTEGRGMAVLMAFGVNTADALAIMLIQRVLGAILSCPIAAISLLGAPKYLFIPRASREVGDVNEPLVQVG